MENASILVTGGTGFIGSNIVKHLLSTYPNCKIYVIDRTLKQYNMFDKMFNNVVYFQGLIQDPNIYDKFVNINLNYVFHEAAVVDTTYSNDDIYDINSHSLNLLYNLCVKSGATLVYASSAATYGNSPSPNIVGEGEEPLNKYGKSKLLMDQIALKLMEQNKINIVGLRYFNVYGPRESHKDEMASMIYKSYNKLIANQTINLIKWGDQCRDFIYVDDIVKGNILAALSGKSGIYNLGTGIKRNFSDMMKILVNETQKKSITINYINNPYPFFQNNTMADISKSFDDLNYLPDFTFETGIAKYVSVLNVLNMLNVSNVSNVE